MWCNFSLFVLRHLYLEECNISLLWEMSMQQNTQINCHGLVDTFLKLVLVDDYFSFPVWWWVLWGYSLLLMAGSGLFLTWPWMFRGQWLWDLHRLSFPLGLTVTGWLRICGAQGTADLLYYIGANDYYAAQLANAASGFSHKEMIKQSGNKWNCSLWHIDTYKYINTAVSK